MAIKVLKSGISAEDSAAISKQIQQNVESIIDAIRQDGDQAIRKYSDQFDSWNPESFKLSQEEIDEHIASGPKKVMEDIAFAQK